MPAIALATPALRRLNRGDPIATSRASAVAGPQPNRFKPDSIRSAPGKTASVIVSKLGSNES